MIRCCLFRTLACLLRTVTDNCGIKAEWCLPEKTEKTLGKFLLLCRFLQRESHMTSPEIQIRGFVTRSLRLIAWVYPYNRPLEAHRFVRRRGSQSSRQSAHRWRWGCQPYAPAALYPPGWFLVLISVRGWVHPRAIVRLEGLGQLKIGIVHATFREIECHKQEVPSRNHEVLFHIG
jgi:hypothetical protein